MKHPIDLARLKKGKFQITLTFISVICLVSIWFLYPKYFLGFFVSFLFQWTLLELKLVLFWWDQIRSVRLFGILGLFSLVGNAVLLGIGLQNSGVNFILGFFLAYFGFLTIFVFVALNSRDSRLPQ